MLVQKRDILSDAKSRIHISACPTPANKTIDFIKYGGQPLPQPVHPGTLSDTTKGIPYTLQPKIAKSYILN